MYKDTPRIIGNISPQIEKLPKNFPGYVPAAGALRGFIQT